MIFKNSFARKKVNNQRFYENEHEKAFAKGNDILREFPYDQYVKK